MHIKINELLTHVNLIICLPVKSDCSKYNSLLSYTSHIVTHCYVFWRSVSAFSVTGLTRKQLASQSVLDCRGPVLTLPPPPPACLSQDNNLSYGVAFQRQRTAVPLTLSGGTARYIAV